jgi:hypothetical protein
MGGDDCFAKKKKTEKSAVSVKITANIFDCFPRMKTFFEPYQF